MHVVIDIPKTAYEYFTQGLRFTDEVEMAIIAIVNGTPLPKGHGRLIDADDVNNHIIGFVDLSGCPTIIEADMESEK